MFNIQPKPRPCGGCTMCCQGWLTGEAWGHKFYPGRPCGWIGARGCAIYENRPRDPCQTFLCEWKRRPDIAEDMRPDRAGAIMVYRSLEQYQYISVVPGPGPVPEQVHAWAREYSQRRQVNIVVSTTAGVRVYTQDPGFRDAAGKVYQILD